MKFVHDTKTGERKIIGQDIKCYACRTSLEKGSYAYYGDKTKQVFCKNCLTHGRGSDENIYHWGKIVGESYD